MRTAASLLEELQQVDESTTIEAKTAAKVGSSILETVCAFSNEPGLGGGHLLLGVVRSQQGGLFGAAYDVVGVPHPDQLQADLASQCASSFNLPVRPQLAVERLDGKSVVVVFVPELSATDKPLFLKNLGLPRGAFRRIGSTDQQGTEDDLVALYNDRSVESYDGSIIKDSGPSDLDPEAIRAYRELRAAANPVAEELAWSDDDLLRALNAVAPDGGASRLTVAGLLLFGTSKALRRCFPMMRIDYIRIPGREWVKDPDRRFDTVEIRAPLVLAARRAISAVRDDLPASFSLPEGEAIRSSETILPVRVLREAIVNAVMHRSYRIQGAIQILRYSNRLEIRNPGHSLKAVEHLGEPGSQTRNPRIAAVLHEVNLAETKGSGIRAMRELMNEHNLLQPTFESTRQPDQFVATFLFHHFLGKEDLAWLSSLTEERLSDEESRALVFVREAGAIDNSTYRTINSVETLAASAHLRRLRDLDLLEMKGSGNRTYYVPGTSLGRSAETEMPPKVAPGMQAGASIHEVATGQHQPPPIHPTSEADLHQLSPDLHQPSPDLHHLRSASTPPPDDLPADLAGRIRAAGLRPRESALRAVILELCAHGPKSAAQIASLLGGRDPKNLVRLHLGPMLAAGQLAYTFPQMPNHPDQKYTVPSAGA